MKIENVEFEINIFKDEFNIFINGKHLTSICSSDVKDETMECLPQFIQEHFEQMKGENPLEAIKRNFKENIEKSLG